jgi:hypothetical protein
VQGLTGLIANGAAVPSRHGLIPDPFDDLASRYLPRTMPNAMRWSERIFLLDGTFAQAMQRVASYFVTDIEVRSPNTDADDVTDQEKDKFETYLKKKQRALGFLRKSAIEYLAYGNVFVSVLEPFRRYIVCPSKNGKHNCGMRVPCREFTKPGNGYKFKWQKFEFHGTCPVCGYSGRWLVKDIREADESKLTLKSWSVHEIDIRYNRYSGRKEFIWKIPEIYRAAITNGDPHLLEDAPLPVIRAIAKGQVLLFNDGVIHHESFPAPSGIDTEGWGLAPALTNFRQAMHCQLLRRLNEAIASDYIHPFRVITPDVSPGGAGQETGDPLVTTNQMMFTRWIAAMLKRRRIDPAAWNFSPFPLKYTAMGAEANQLAPYQLIAQAVDEFLNASGVPAELYKGSLTAQTAPASLRLFQSHWIHLIDAMNAILEFIVDRSAQILNWEPVDAQLVKPTIADDLNRQMALLQLMTSGNVSQSTALRSVGADFKDEQVRTLQENDFIAKITADFQKNQQGVQQQNAFTQQAIAAPQQPQQLPQQQAPGQSAPQGQPPAPGGSSDPATTTVLDLRQKAQEIAQRINQMPEAQKDSELIALRKSDPDLHALVRSIRDQIRQRERTAGGAQMHAQQKQGKAWPVTPGAATLRAAIRVRAPR